MTLGTITALLGTMIVLALIPSVSVLAVVSRSAVYGFAHGVATAVGILLGDIIFILIAIYGLTILADLIGSRFIFFKYLGGMYLIWLGVQLWRVKPNMAKTADNNDASLHASLLMGLLITLADQKAILFYLGLFPAYLDLSKITFVETGIIIAIATIAIGSKLIYAFMADRASLMLNNHRAIQGLNMVAGSVMLVVGLYVILKP